MTIRIFCLGVLLVCFGAAAFGQGTRKTALIVNECQERIKDLGCAPEGREIVAYHFADGKRDYREVLMARDKFPFEFRFPGDVEYIYQNRFLISDGGDVYDLQKHKIVFRNNEGGILTQNAERTVQNLGVVKVIGDKLYVRLAVSDQEATNREGFFAYNLQTGEFKKIRDAGKFPELRAPNFAPDAKTIAVVEKMKLVFYAVDGAFNFRKLKSVALAGDVAIDDEDDISEDFSIVWIDNKSVLTQNDKGDVIRIDSSGKISPVLKLKNFTSESTLPKIRKDKFGNFLLYPCNDDKRTCQINLQTKKLAEIDCEPLGNGFSATFEKKKSNDNFWQYEFFYKGKLIGKNRKCFNAQTTKDFIAIEDADKYENVARIHVWNDIIKVWTNIDLKWHSGDLIIGWIE
jgi:hypothetical protein